MSGFLNRSLVKKYWMAATGLFLCLFLVGHVSGNLQLLIPGYEGKLQFNEYAVFMTSNPAVKILSYLTYFSIIFHVIDGILLTRANKKARPQGYVYNKPQRNSIWSSRNMGVLGTIILVFIVFHMQDFWYEYKFGEIPYMVSEQGHPITKSGEVVVDGVINSETAKVIKNGEVAGLAMKDLHEEVMEAFQVPWIVIVYVISMIAIAFHLWHGFSSAFQSIGINHDKYTPIIKKAGYAFAVVIPLLFAIIPVIIYLK